MYVIHTYICMCCINTHFITRYTIIISQCVYMYMYIISNFWGSMPNHLSVSGVMTSLPELPKYS